MTASTTPRGGAPTRWLIFAALAAVVLIAGAWGAGGCARTGIDAGWTQSHDGGVAGGDAGAVRECLDAYGGLVWSLARRLSPGEAEAEDAVQEIFIELWSKAGRYDEGRASETTFVAMIARRRLIDRWRQRGRRLDEDALDVNGLPIAADDDDRLSSFLSPARPRRPPLRLAPRRQSGAKPRAP